MGDHSGSTNSMTYMTAVSYAMPEAKGGEMKIMEAKKEVISDLRHFWLPLTNRRR